MSPKRIEQLTDAQKMRMGEWADRWIEIGLRTGPADRVRFEDAARRCYEYAGVPWHGNVVWVPSPLVVAFAGPIAAFVLQQRGDTVHGAVDAAVHNTVRAAVHAAVHGTVRVTVGGTVDAAVDGAVHAAVHGEVHNTVRAAVHAAVHDTVRVTVGDTVTGAVGDTVVGDTVHDTVHAAVHAAVHDTVRDTVGDTSAAPFIHQNWPRYLGGQFWVGGWGWGGAWSSFFREVCNLELPGDLWDRARAYEATMESACWWWPHRQFLIVSERPQAIHLEQIGPRGWGSHRLHREDGPAVRFDGWDIYSWHGIRVPAWVIEAPTVERIAAEENTEVRRCAIESYGWDRFVVDAQLQQCAPPADDPGNPGQVLRLYDVPERLWGAPVRLLVCANGTPERDGTRRVYGLPVDASLADPLAAAAWTYDVDVDLYASIERRA